MSAFTLTFLGLNIKPEVSKLPNPSVACCFQFDGAHYICQWAIICGYCEVWGIKKIIPEFDLHSPI